MSICFIYRVKINFFAITCTPRILKDLYRRGALESFEDGKAKGPLFPTSKKGTKTQDWNPLKKEEETPFLMNFGVSFTSR